MTKVSAGIEALIITYLSILFAAGSEGVTGRPNLSTKKWKDMFDSIGAIFMVESFAQRIELFGSSETNSIFNIKYFGDAQASFSIY